jgi:phosphotransferase system HPr (HPr) family protein
MKIFERTIDVIDPIGLHARPASQIVKAVKQSGLVVHIGRKGRGLIAANSPLQLMALKVKTGETLSVSIQAPDEDTADALVTELQELLKG